MKSKGDVPVPYIIALILGAMVLGFIAYSLFYSNNEFSISIREKKCEYQKMMYCSSGELNNYAGFAGIKKSDGTCPMEKKVGDDMKSYYAPNCCEFDWANSVTC